MNKKLLLSFVLFFTFLINYGQCLFGGSQFTTTQSICYNREVSGTNVGGLTFASVSLGNYVGVNVISGLTYTISATTNSTGFIKRITLFNSSNTTSSVGTAVAGANNSSATITNWVATFTGTLYIRYNNNTNCNDTSSGSSAISVTYTGGSNNLDSPTAQGTNSWIGHVYDFSNTAGVPPSDTDAFANYLGSFNQANTTSGTTTSFTQNYGGDDTCFSFTAGGTSQSARTDTFVVRYRMNSKLPVGCYFVRVTGDDGVRLFVDGVKVFDAWTQQGATLYDYVLIRLTGNSELIFDYYEKNGANVSNFSISPVDPNSNTVTAPAVSSVCSATSPGILDGSAYTYNNSSVNPSIKYQWQSAPDVAGVPGTWSNVTTGSPAASPGSLEDYTPATVTTTTTTNITWYRRNITGTASNASACTFNSNEISITTSPATAGGTVAATPAICSGTPPGNLTLSGHKGSVLKWQKATDTGFTTGLADILVTTTTLPGTTIGNLTVTTYFRAVVQNGGCSVQNSGSTVVTVNALPTITSHPTTSVQTVCLNGSLTALSVTAGSGTIKNYKWYSNTIASNSGGTLVQTNTVTTSTNTYTPPTTVPATLYYYVVVTNSNDCTVTSNISGLITVNSLPTITSQPTNPSATCEGSGTQTITVAATGAGLGYSWMKGATVLSDGGVINGQGTPTLTLINPLIANAGIYTVVITGTCSPPVTSNPVTVTVNALPSAPTVGTTTNVGCSSLGSIDLSGLPSTWTLTQISTAGTVTTTGTTPTYKVSNLPVGTYKFTVSNGTCTSVSTSNVTISDFSSTSWNGSIWTFGLPDATKNVTFASAFPISADLSACSCTISSGVTMTVPSGVTLNITNALTVLGSATLTFNNGASLVQDQNTTVNSNSGNIFFKRNTTPVRRKDYTYWSSPVDNFTLHSLSSTTYFDKYYRWLPTTGWESITNGADPMIQGVGYIVRAPESYSLTAAVIYNATFMGVPNNGDVNVTPTGGKWNLIGNPYPSALDAVKFIQGNTTPGSETIVGAVYFWTHNTPPDNTDPAHTNWYIYTTDDYAVLNLSGTVVATEAVSDSSPTNNAPTGNIASGQGFFVKALTNNQIKFTNKMRVAGADNSQFFKTASTAERDRLWLNFKNTQGAFKQLLVAYVDGASDSWDNNYDATTYSASPYVDFYSLNETRKLTIQGRAVPFVNSDQVPLGYKSTIVGDFTISIDHAEGVFNQQPVYLEDKTTGTIHDLRTSDYTFTSPIGTFTERFILRYTNKTLGTGDFENLENGVLVSVKNKIISIVSSKENISEVTIFDITGKLLYNKKKVGDSLLQIQNLQSANQVLLVKVVLENDAATTRKIIFQ